MLECKNINVKFDKKCILNNFNYIFNNNNIYSIMGCSGIGKTTLLRTIAGLQKHEGQILLNDYEIKKPNKKIMMMHQHYNNFPWLTCEENLLFPIKLNRKIDEKDKKLIKKMLIEIGLIDYIYKYPYELSGGMNQRLALARAIISNPQILLMDEPMSALDIKTRILMQDLIMKYQKINKNIIILVTHDIDEANKMSNKNNIINF